MTLPDGKLPRPVAQRSGSVSESPLSRFPGGPSKPAKAALAAVVQCWPWAADHFDLEDSLGIWSEAVDGLTEAELRHGIKRVARFASQFPPSPGTFRQMCQQQHECAHSRPGARHQESDGSVVCLDCTARLC